MKRELVLDRETDRILEGLASTYPGGANSVVSDAIRVFASVEDRLEEIVTDPGFVAMMKRSSADVREGRVVPHRQAMALVRTRRSSRGRNGKP
jgi:hypothetical protein